ncbi:unnamed protein product [Didymodactylos carnosus]|uniref:Uncharacterized protein n=1 Tax=Didymodactylos carnosus TaxID=1234261 RepID=A0A815RW52_9BILA|nr:unnamed protein product [Didymodactylos carnosus]CAF4347140.1 unnamed protein product [Didymodactylos carnosus]
MASFAVVVLVVFGYAFNNSYFAQYQVSGALIISLDALTTCVKHADDNATITTDIVLPWTDSNQQGFQVQIILLGPHTIGGFRHMVCHLRSVKS